MNNFSPVLLADFYKLSHRLQYPENTTLVYSTWTPRTSRIPGVDQVVHFGTQAFLKKVTDIFNINFFFRPKDRIVKDYIRIIKNTLGDQNPDTTHIEALHDLGYLPLEIKALAEGTIVPTRTPVMTIQNTLPEFFWLTNYLETLASCELWQASTSATLAFQYRKILTKAARDTGGDEGFVQFQGHDFSMRGMSSLESAVSSGMGHLLSFVGTDTVPAIGGLEQYYNANVTKELVGTSIPATEHSVQCAYGNDDRYFEAMISKVQPSGFVSIVSDGTDFWDVVGRVLPNLKDKIMARDGKVVIRPDSGDPVKIICGSVYVEELKNLEELNSLVNIHIKHADQGYPPEDVYCKVGKQVYNITYVDFDDMVMGIAAKPVSLTLEQKGTIEALWDIFGGTVNEKGFKVLDSHIGCIYGDAITLVRAQEICDQLKTKGFASTNVVYGIGSYTYQYNTRDTFGYALKSTLCVINGDEKQIFKNPKTDDGTKKSAKGRVAVRMDMGEITTVDQLNLNTIVEGDLLQTVYKDGKFLVDESLSTIRARLLANLDTK